MRETKFIAQNKEKWTEFEELLKEKNTDPDRLNRLFVEITDDLSYARTFYPNRSVRYYLNGLAQQLFQRIYKNKSPKNRFTHFWKEELPQIIWASRRELLLSFSVFALAFAIGMLSCAMDIDFLRTILGDGYVDMTNENILKDDPMAVYKQQNEVDMFLGITLNNLQVDFLTFISGILAGLGTIGVLINNGIMIGAFQYFFVEKGVFWESFLTVWVHGTIEISTIILSGAAGLVMGKGLVFPGTYTRLQAFQITARRGLKILMSVIPLTIMAGFFEGFLTRHTETPDVLRLAIIIASALFILGYFVWYPWRMAKAGFAKPLEDEKLLAASREPMNYTSILTIGEIFQQAVSFLLQHSKILLRFALATAVVYCLFGYLSMGQNFIEIFPTQGIQSGSVIAIFFAIGQVFEFLSNLFDYSNALFLFVLNTLGFASIGLFISYLMAMHSPSPNLEVAPKLEWKSAPLFLNFLKILPVSLLLNSLLFLPVGLPYLFGILLLPICGIYTFVMVKEQLNLATAIERTFALLGNNWGKMYGIFGITLLIGLAFFVLLNSGIFWFYFEVIQWNIDAEKSTILTLAQVFSALVSVFVFTIIIPLYFVSLGLLYFTLLEIKEANGLRARIMHIGQKRQVYGLEME